MDSARFTVALPRPVLAYPAGAPTDPATRSSLPIASNCESGVRPLARVFRAADSIALALTPRLGPAVAGRCASAIAEAAYMGRDSALAIANEVLLSHRRDGELGDIDASDVLILAVRAFEAWEQAA